ncbi:MAG: AsmA family protein [Candidatus Delongbacteria bacterium]|nr:AsmA family protein [Candidatus Delongbacteria bacterium]
MKITKKKILKLFLYLAGLFLLFILGLFLMLQYFFPSSFVKSQIEKYVMDNYGISLKINELDFSLFSGIEVTDFSIKDNDIPDSLFSFDSFQLKYDLLPLKDKKLVINKLTVQHPKISIVRDKNGRFNFDGIIEKLKNKQKTVEEPDKIKDVSNSSFVVNLENLDVNNVELLYDDSSPESPIKAKLPRYNVKLRNVKFKDLDDMKVDLSISTAENNSFSIRFKDNSAELKQDLNLNVKVVNENINVNIIHSLSSINFRNKDISLKNVGAKKVDMKISYNLKTDSLSIGKLQFSFADMISAELTGNVKNVSTSQIAEIKITRANVNFDKILDFIKENKLLEPPPVLLTDTQLSVKDLTLMNVVSTGNTEIKGTSYFNSSKIIYREKDILAVINDLNTEVAFELGINIKDIKLDKSIIGVKSKIRNISANVQGQKYKINNISAEITPVLTKDLKPQSVLLTANIGEILDGNINLSTNVDLSGLSDFSTGSIIENIVLKLDVSGNGIKPYRIAEQVPKGLSISFVEHMDIKKSNVSNKFNLSTKFIQLKDEEKLFSPLNNFELKTFFSVDLKNFKNEVIILDTINAKLADFNETIISNVNIDLKNSILNIGSFKTDTDLYNTLKLIKLTKEPMIANTSIGKGQVYMDAHGRFSYADMTGSGNAEINMLIENLSHDDLMIKDFVKINEKIIASENNISLVGDVNISDLDYHGILKSYDIKGDINLKNSITYFTNGEIRINKAGVDLPDIQTSASLTGKADISTKVPTFNLEAQHNIGLRKEYPAVSQLKDIRGLISGTTKLSGDTNYVYIINHTEAIKGFNAKVNLDSTGSQYAQINNMNIQFPFNLIMKLPEYDISKAEFIITDTYDDNIDFREYSENRETYARYGLPVSTVTADEIEINHPMLKDKMKNLDVDMYYDDNKLTINRYYFELLDGNATGFLKLDLGKGKMDESIMKRAVLDFNFMASGMNTYYLSNKENSEQASTELNTTMTLNSIGLDFINNPNLNGEINVSKISAGDAKYLLEFLNKSSGDQTAGMLKNMLNLFPGIKVDLFSFKIKNNFLYTLIKLKKPWYLFYFPLAEEIKLSKQSLKFYIDKYVVEE